MQEFSISRRFVWRIPRERSLRRPPLHRRHRPRLQQLLQPLLPLLHRNPVRRRLTVNSGNADGRYYSGADVVVTANDPPRRYVFDRWDGDWEFLSNPLSPTTTFKMPDRNCLHHGALQEDKRAVSQSPSRTKPCNAKVRRPYLRASTTARRTHRWRKLRRIDHWDCISLAAYGPRQTRLILLFADEPQDRRLVFLEAWITPDARIDEKVVVKVIVGGGDLANDALVREGPKLMIDSGD